MNKEKRYSARFDDGLIIHIVDDRKQQERTSWKPVQLLRH
jgi:hypothetical protein